MLHVCYESVPRKMQTHKTKRKTLNKIYKISHTENQFRLMLNQIKIQVQREKPRRDFDHFILQ